jgi:hypothetical protein
VERERLRLRQALRAVQSESSWFEPAKLVFEFSSRAASCFQTGDERQKRSILGIVGSNFSLKNGKLSIDARKPFRRWSGEGSTCDWSGAVEDVRTFLLDETCKPAEMVEKMREVLEETPQRIAA